MRIVVLGGGISTERHVSLVTATSVCKALRQRGHQAVFVDLFLGMEKYEKSLEKAFAEPDGLCIDVAVLKQEPDLEKVWNNRELKSNGHIGKNVIEICSLADCVFLGLHGKDGEDGKIQALMELIGVPYTGSGPLASAISMDKAMAKRVLKGCGVLTPEWQEIVCTKEINSQLLGKPPLPCVVKVNDGGSSLGVEFPETFEQLYSAIQNVQKYGRHIIVEQRIYGRELTVPVLDGKAMSPILIIPPKGKQFNYVAKYQSGEDAAQEICPAGLSEEEEKLLRTSAERVYHELGLNVYCRVDFILDQDGRAWFLEVNTLPGMTPNSLVPKSAKFDGLEYGELCEKIVSLSMNIDRSL